MGNESRSILLVEDDVVICESLVELLELEGFRIHVVHDGEEALHFLNQSGDGDPGVILLDLMMPVCSGYEFLKRWQQNPKFDQISVIIMSAGSNAQETGQLYGVPVIKKPFDGKTLFALIDETFMSQRVGASKGGSAGFTAEPKANIL